MKCTKCGADITEGASFCTACGAPVNNENTQTNNQPVQNNKQKTPWGLIIGVVVLALVIVTVFVGISLSKEEESTKENNEEKTQVEEQEPQEAETKTVTYSDYTFEVPGDLITSSTSSQLLIMDAENTIAEAVIYQSGTDYSTLASMKDQLIDLLKSQETSQSQNYDFTNAITTEKTYGNKKFLVTSGVAQDTIDLDITYAEADGGVFIISIAKTDGKITEADRDMLYQIVANAK